MKKYDVIVIGMGPAGMAVSNLAYNAGLNVLAIEKDRVGGECLNCGCIPSKALLKAAELKSSVNYADKFGIVMDKKADVGNVFEIIRDKINGIGKSKASKMFENVDSIIGKQAEFVEPHIIKVDNNLFCAEGAIFIATGSAPFIPPIKGIENVPYLTNKNMFKIDHIPESLTIIGGGAIASEMAMAFKRLGTKRVDMINMDSHLIPVVDNDVSDVLEAQFLEEGINIHNSTKALSAEKIGNTIVIKTDKGIFESQELLIAAGRKPSLEYLNLDKIGIKYNSSGIEVDEFNTTNMSHIYAVGDCNGKNLFSHSAMHQGMLSVMHYLGFKEAKYLKRSNYPVPWAIFSDPEVAHVGLTEQQVKKLDIEYQVTKDYYKDYGRSLIDGKDKGFIKVISDTEGKILGASIIGNGASELIAEWTMAVQNNISLQSIAFMQHAFPSLSLMNLRVAQKWMMMSLNKSKIAKNSAANLESA